MEIFWKMVTHYFPPPASLNQAFCYVVLLHVTDGHRVYSTVVRIVSCPHEMGGHPCYYTSSLIKLKTSATCSSSGEVTV